MFHKEGYKIIFISLILMAVGVVLSGEYIENIYLQKTIQIFLLVSALLILQFFRNPARITKRNPKHIMAPVDGKIVAIEKVHEPEYFKDQRLQVSIFMTPLNVHVTRYPVSGNILYSKYHPGKYLVASHPKSSTENERTTIVVNSPEFGPILYRQIAGAVARRIVNYAKVGDQAMQGKDAGFIKFGSRVDLFLPVDSLLQVKLGDKVRGGEQVIALKF